MRSEPHRTGDADLALAPNGTGFVALWAVRGGEIQLTTVDAQLTAQTSSLATGPVDGIAGVTAWNTGALTFAAVTPTGHDLWQVPTPATAMRVRSEPRAAAREAIVSDGIFPQRAWVRGDANGMAFSFVSSTGVIGIDQGFTTTNPVVAIAAADQGGHTHVTWAEKNNAGGSDCTQADLDLQPPAPFIGGTSMMATDCHEPRIDSGPPAADAIFTVYRTGTRVIATRYLGAVVNTQSVLAAAGRAPKVRFDGTRFWVAWIDETGGDHLRIASVDESLAATAVDLPGWTVAGDEAFELVRVGNTVYLVLLSADALTVMHTCFP